MTPASGAVVMGTGIVSIDLALDGHETISRVVLVIAACVWAGLAVLLAARVVVDGRRVREQATSPAALTGVAGTAVLGTRLAMLGWSWAGAGLLAVSLALWLVLVVPVLGHWTTPAVGVSFVLTVATEALSVLAVSEDARWLLYAALVPFALGLAFYAFVLARFDLRQLLVGRGDQWICGGALAISALAAARIAAADPGIAGLKVVALVVWGAAMLWLPALVAAELVRPRLEYDIQRWGTVFPVGMYAGCSFAVGTAAGATALTRFASVWTWVAFAVWLVAFGAMLRRALA